MKDDSFIFRFMIGLVLGIFVLMLIGAYMIKNNTKNGDRYNMSRHERITQQYKQLIETETEAI